MKKIHSELGADLHNKGEATKFTMKCMTLELNISTSLTMWAMTHGCLTAKT